MASRPMPQRQSTRSLQKIDATRWLVPATRAAIEAAAADVGTINDAQGATVDRLQARLGT